MKDNKPFAMFFNASPRKGWNTHKMLEAAKAGAEEAGAETELVNLYDIKFPGCKSCFACKLKNAKTNGVCAIRDDLRPVLERARQADVLVLGSPAKDPGVELHVDHIFPWSKGGETVLENLQTLCSRCNGGKSKFL